MRVLTLIKQVPATTSVEMDKEKGTLMRAGAKGKLNPFDLFAIETALELKARFSGEVITLSMGPIAAVDSLREAIYMGVDEAFLISDAHFAGSDVLATSRTLAEGVKYIGDYDLIICGKQTTDGDTAQVGAETAEWLGIPHMNNVVSKDSLLKKEIIVTVETEEEISTVKMPLPCLICVDKDINSPRLPSYLRKKKYKDKEIKVLTLVDFSITDPHLYGSDGSPTQVVKIFEPDNTSKSERIEGTPEDVSMRLVTALREERLV